MASHLDFSGHPQRDSNPRCRLERASRANRLTWGFTKKAQLRRRYRVASHDRWRPPPTVIDCP